jgi:hypothetical protein
MKQYSQWNNLNHDQVKPDSLNLNVRESLSVWNGWLDGTNLPVNSVDNTKLVQPTSTNITSSGIRSVSWQGQTQSYRSIRHYSASDFEGALTDWQADTTINLKTSSWTKGWNHLTDELNYNNFYMDFEAKEGMLNGCVVIDYWRGVNIVVDDVTSAYFVYGYDWWVRWGLFCNDILIAESGNTHPRGQSIVIPFKIPTGTQQVRFDLRWQAITSAMLDAGHTYVADPSTPIDIFGAEIWVCNTYK